MKKHLVLLLALAVVLVLASCTKEKANYYVKYEASAYTMSSGMSVSVNTEDGIQSYYISGKTFSETYGPVSKGFKATISAYAGSGTMNTSIYVSRGEEPFVLKATGGKTAEYVIDF